jgi:hypothetical protein
MDGFTGSGGSTSGSSSSGAAPTRHTTAFEPGSLAPWVRQYGDSGHSSSGLTETARRSFLTAVARKAEKTKYLALADSDKAIRCAALYVSAAKLLKHRPDGNYGLFQILTRTVTLVSGVPKRTFFLGTTGAVAPAATRKAFVLLLDGSLRIGDTHAKLALQGQVLFAGEVSFKGNGRVQEWNNQSGTYTIGAGVASPAEFEASKGLVPFPQKRFKKYGA